MFMLNIKLWIFGIITIIINTVTTTDIKCDLNGDKCLCLKTTDKYEYQCPTNNDIKYVIHITPQKYVEIDCYDLDIFNIQYLPDLRLNKIETVEFKSCPLPNKFKDIFDKFHINDVNSIRFRFGNLGDNVTLTKEIFEGLTSLEELKFTDEGLINIDEDVFENTPNLIVIDLYANKLNLKKNLFQYTKKVKWIDLHFNQLNHLPNGFFNNLNNLESLHLWNNKLTNIDKKFFRNLTNLKSLELSQNKLEYLDEDLFVDLVELRELNLMSNNLKELPYNLFKNNKKLRNLRLNDNPNLVLPNYLFANLNNLEIVKIQGVNLSRGIPEGLFENCTNLKHLNLGSSQLDTLPENLLKTTKSLEELNLFNNKIKSLPFGVFSTLNKLKLLDMENNLWEEVNEKIYENLKNLEKLNLKSNKLTKLSPNLCNEGYLANIKELYLAKNQLSVNNFDYLTYKNDFTFNNCIQLEILDLSNNNITDFNLALLTLTLIKSIDLSNNFIKYLDVTDILITSRYDTKVDLSKNLIENIHFDSIIRFDDGGNDAMNERKIIVILDDNLLNCNCNLTSLLLYAKNKLHPKIIKKYQIKMDGLTCATPEKLKDVLIKEIPLRNLICPIMEMDKSFKCPKRCSCFSRSIDKAIVFDCSNQNLTIIPNITLPNIEYNHTEVYLQGNELIKGPESSLIGYYNVTLLNMSNNILNNITWLPPKIKTLYLDNNKLRRLDDDVLNNLKNIERLSLQRNAWICDCKALKFTNFIRKNLKLMVDANITCQDTNKSLVEQTETSLCHSLSWVYLLILGLILITILAISVALYYRYQVPIKVWLYAHNLCLWWVTEDELDKDKIYDAFISYSHQDEDFLIEHLLPVLENKENPYKLCIHVRDWIPGDSIQDQIIRSVNDSRRTIVILSNNFLESVWAKVEFKTAHERALHEGRARVIVILYGDVNFDKLDDVLKAYLSTNTYVKWGDPWFWNKLRYAMPHFKSFKKSNIKHANIMAKIDDKFSLKVVDNSETTPPVLTMDKKNPFKTFEEDSLMRAAA